MGRSSQSRHSTNTVIRGRLHKAMLRRVSGGREGFELGRVTFQFSKLLMRIHARIPTDPPKFPYLPPDLPPEPSCKMTGPPVRRYRLRIQLQSRPQSDLAARLYLFGYTARSESPHCNSG